jgi:hypothetical protein
VPGEVAPRSLAPNSSPLARPRSAASSALEEPQRAAPRGLPGRARAASAPSYSSLFRTRNTGAKELSTGRGTSTK